MLPILGSNCGSNRRKRNAQETGVLAACGNPQTFRIRRVELLPSTVRHCLQLDVRQERPDTRRWLSGTTAHPMALAPMAARHTPVPLLSRDTHPLSYPIHVAAPAPGTNKPDVAEIVN